MNIQLLIRSKALIPCRRLARISPRMIADILGIACFVAIFIKLGVAELQINHLWIF